MKTHSQEVSTFRGEILWRNIRRCNKVLGLQSSKEPRRHESILSHKRDSKASMVLPEQKGVDKYGIVF